MSWTTITLKIVHEAMGLRGWSSCWQLVATVRFSFHTNLQAALDKVEGHHCCMCDAAAQDTPKATQGIVLWGAKLAADILCSRREGTHTCNMQDYMQHRTKINTKPEPHNGRVATTEGKSFLRPVSPCPSCGQFEFSARTLPLDGSTTNMPPFIRITHTKGW